jgi:gamma-glutamylcyclotransferase (GGCT)/AIG2-like uncharacterized protein YtfP
LFCSHQITLTQNAGKENDLSSQTVHFGPRRKICGGHFLKNAMNSENLLFVYGTLLSGLSNHHHMTGATCLGEASVQAALFDMGEYPALCVQGAWAQPLGLVLGELYKIETEQWQRLDELEEVDPDSLENSMYLRVPIQVQWRQTERPQAGLITVAAQVYVYNWSLAGRPRIEHGDFRRHWSMRT